MSSRIGLGKGLGALIPTGASSLEEIPTSLVVPNHRQPRRHFDEDAIADLSASIRQVGLLQPLVVRPVSGGNYELVVGERRWRAARRAGLATVPALVIETDDRGALQRALVENIHRTDLNPIEEAAAYQQLFDEGGLTHEQLAERLGLSRPAVTNALRLLDLPAPVQKMVVDGLLTAGHARALLGLGAPALIERAAGRVAAEGLSVRSTEDLVRNRKLETGPATPPTRRGAPPHAPGLLEVSDKLSDHLQTRVTVAVGKRKGKIVIEFGSVGDLDRIFSKIVGEPLKLQDEQE